MVINFSLCCLPSTIDILAHHAVCAQGGDQESISFPLAFALIYGKVILWLHKRKHCRVITLVWKNTETMMADIACTLSFTEKSFLKTLCKKCKCLNSAMTRLMYISTSYQVNSFWSHLQNVCVGNVLGLDQGLRTDLVLGFFQLVKHEKEAGEMLVKDEGFTSIFHSLDVK